MFEVGYYLDEERNWALDAGELDRAIRNRPRGVFVPVDHPSPPKKISPPPKKNVLSFTDTISPSGVPVHPFCLDLVYIE